MVVFVFILLGTINYFEIWIIWKIVIFVIFILVFVYFIFSVFEEWNDENLDKVLPKEIKKYLNFSYYKIRWVSKEFEDYLGKDIVDLYEDSFRLLNEYRYGAQSNFQFSDYSFVVAPLAKAYEGVLKKVLVETGVIKKSDLIEDPDLSIGGYFNPQGNTKIVEFLRDKSRDKAVPHVIYSTYQECRNKIFHYDTFRDERISLDDAEFYMNRIKDAIYKAVRNFQKKRRTHSLKISTQTLEIIEAKYGSGNTYIDITEKLNSLIQNNILKTTLSNNIAGDPTPGIAKKGKVKFKFKSRVSDIEISENELISLPI